MYDDIRDKLVARGIPKEEIAYIHDTKTEKQKDELFAKVRSGEVRVLIGSTNCAPYDSKNTPIYGTFIYRNESLSLCFRD